MQVVEFYQEKIPNPNGVFLSEILAQNNGFWEMDHDYIQWVFPSNEVSMMNGNAPVLRKAEADVFLKDKELSDKVVKSFERFLSFLGLKYENGEIFHETLPHIFTFFNHNYLRITRCLKSLRLTNNDKHASALFKYLQVLKETEGAVVSTNTWFFWEDAMFNDLWAFKNWEGEGF